MRKRIHIARRNIQLCFPEKSPSEQKKLLQSHLFSVAMGIIEMAMSWWLDNDTLQQQVHIIGKEHLQNALAQNKGVLLITGHFTTMELCAHTLALSIPFDAMYRPVKNALMDAVVKHARETRIPHTTIFSRDNMRMLLRCLHNKRAVWYAPDQDYGLKQGIYVPFFSIPAATITSTAKIANKTGALVVPYFPQRLPDHSYQITLLPALDNYPSNDPYQDALRINQLIETYIRKAPEQYLWLHRRFKTHPDGKNTLYSSL